VIQRLFHLDFSRADDRNAWYLVAEIFFASILAGAINFNGAYIVRLGATNTEIGLLTSIPALLAVFLSIPAGRFLGTLPRRKPWLLASLMVYRFGFMLVALIPWLGIQFIQPGTLAVSFLIVMSIPAILFNVGFTAMLADIIPTERRVSVFTARNAISSAVASVCVFLFGQFLSHGKFPSNYQILFIFGFTASLLSLYNLTKLQVPDSIVKTQSLPGKRSLRQRWDSLVRIFSSEPAFVRIMFNTFIYSIGMWVATPLYIIYYVRELKATDAWLGLLGTIANLSVLFGYAIWRWMIPRLGEKLTIKVTFITMGLMPLMIGLSSSLTFILLAVALNGLLSPGASLTQLTMLLKSMPEASRPEYTAIYTAIINGGVFIFPLLGVALAGQFGISPTLIGCGLVAILGACSFWVWPVE
jgi:MFS family permease